jgi:phosphate acetyltransferase
MLLPHGSDRATRALVFADCAVNIDPTSEELADIALASARSAQQVLAETPRVALLSFSTRGSASHARVEKITEALRIVRRRNPELAVDGELQADAALDPTVAAKKVPGGSAVAGQANVLIFPDLDSGNIGYKLTQYLAGAQAIGPFLQGFAKPVSDLSRGASVEDVVATTAITLAQV